jgi:hypothetical protein
MKSHAARILSVALALALLVTGAGAVFAATNGTITPTDPDTAAYTYTANTDDSGTGIDYVMGICFDASNNVLDTDREDGSVSGVETGSFTCSTSVFGTGTETVDRWELRDISSDLDTNDSSVIGQILAAPLLATTKASAAGGFQGPPIPAGFVLRTITCDMAVFDAPGGTPVGSNRVKAGQTFYVNPTTKTDASGVSWTQIFVSSTSNPWIWSSCVQ